MCQAAITLISNALPEVDNAESLLKIKNLIALFMQTMNVRRIYGRSYCPTVSDLSTDMGIPRSDV
jgi:hypothetical protein